MNVEKYFEPGWVIYRNIITQDSMGGITHASSSQASVSGLMRPLSGELKLSADKNTAFGTHRFYCLPTTNLLSGDYLSTGGVRYEVKFPADVMNFGRLMQCDCEVVK